MTTKKPVCCMYCGKELDAVYDGDVFMGVSGAWGVAPMDNLMHTIGYCCDECHFEKAGVYMNEIEGKTSQIFEISIENSKITEELLYGLLKQYEQTMGFNMGYTYIRQVCKNHAMNGICNECSV